VISAEMATVKLTKTQAISAMILNELNKDRAKITKEDLKSAIDTVLGEGSYDKLVDGFYQAAQLKR
jgi:hypothetical protein